MQNAKIPGLHLREARNKEVAYGPSWRWPLAPPFRGGFRPCLAEENPCAAEPKYYFIFGTIKGGGFLDIQ